MVAAGQIIRTSDVRRLVGRVVIDSNSSDIATTETVVATISSVTFENGRAFEILLDTLVSISTGTTATVNGGRARIRVRKTNAAGAEYVSWFDFSNNANNANQGISLRKKILNTSGSDVTMDLVLTLQEQTSVGTCRLAGNTTGAVGYFEVWDIGSADDLPGINTVS